MDERKIYCNLVTNITKNKFFLLYPYVFFSLTRIIEYRQFYRRLAMNENPEEITFLGVCFEIVKIAVTLVLIFLMFAFSPFTALFGGSNDDNV